MSRFSAQSFMAAFEYALLTTPCGLFERLEIGWYIVRLIDRTAVYEKQTPEEAIYHSVGD